MDLTPACWSIVRGNKRADLIRAMAGAEGTEAGVAFFLDVNSRCDMPRSNVASAG